VQAAAMPLLLLQPSPSVAAATDLHYCRRQRRGSPAAGRSCPGRRRPSRPAAWRPAPRRARPGRGAGRAAPRQPSPGPPREPLARQE
jgi:hypothetical protein